MASHTPHERRRRLTHRALPALVALALVAFAAGLLIGTATESGSERIAKDFTRAWQRGDYAAMYSMLSDTAKSQYTQETFEQAYANAKATATTARIVAASPSGRGDGKVRVPVSADTRVFGTVRGTIGIPVTEDKVDWSPGLVFPGLAGGAQLTRETTAPKRASILSRDGKVLAAGPAEARTHPDAAGSSIAGEVAKPTDDAARLATYARGFPADTPIGTSGLERALNKQVAGTPGGELRAGNTVLARSKPRAAAPARTTIDTRIQAAAVAALAGRLGGVAALDPQNGEVRALAGIAFSAPQPPGSTFKIVTASAGLELNKVKLADKFPVETHAVLDGVNLDNANRESCGGTFAESFAHSCNSVFGPLGAKIGAEGLIEYAKRFGWDAKPTIPGEMPSTFPAADKLQNPLELGSAAIGQSEILATPLQMASVAQTVANGGLRIPPTLIPSAPQKPVRVIERATAKTLAGLMAGVVVYGTGTAAQIEGVKVAGKTGTAELEDTKDEEGNPTGGGPENTDAWFASFAPIAKPKIAVGVLFVRNGAGGTTAAPAAQTVMVAALQK